MFSHKRAIIQIAQYLQCTKERGVIFQPDQNRALECFVDADLAGCWSHADADDTDNSMSCTGYIMRFAVSTKEIDLGTAEVEYIALSQPLRTIIHLMTLVEELSDIFPLYIKKHDLYCKVFEDNQSCISMTKYSKLSPQTNHIALKYHHFKYYVDSMQLIIIYTNFVRSSC